MEFGGDEARAHAFRITEAYYGSLFVLKGVTECMVTKGPVRMVVGEDG